MQARQRPRRPPDWVEPKYSLVAGLDWEQWVQVLYKRQLSSPSRQRAQPRCAHIHRILETSKQDTRKKQ